MKGLSRYAKSIVVFFLTMLWLIGPRPAAAHRLDEYLQATRISVERNGVNLEMDLTAGMAVADRVFAMIDTDRDGKISSIEGASYAELVLNSLSLKLDDHPQRLALTGSRFPSFDDMRAGEGVIRLQAHAKAPPSSVGHHEIAFANTHQQDIGAYLINALVPADDQIRITAQRRDTFQHEFRLEYKVVEPETSWPWIPAGVTAAGLALAAVLWLKPGGLTAYR